MSSSTSFPPFFDTNFNFNSDSSQTPQMQSMNDLPELLKHPCVMDLYRQNQTSQIKLQEAQSKVSEFAEKSLFYQDKNLALQNKVVSLESELSASQLKVNSLSTELQSLQVNL